MLGMNNSNSNRLFHWSKSFNLDPLNQYKNKSFNISKPAIEVCINQPLRCVKGRRWRRFFHHLIIILFSSFDNYFENKYKKQKLLDKGTKLTSIYNSASPIFNELFKKIKRRKIG